uniref:Uncharacterized protein n=1 Tax=Solanum tuberosum TaxID=4113 RepID=M1DR63_SOLTU
MQSSMEGNLGLKDIPSSSQSSLPVYDVGQVQIHAQDGMQQGEVAVLNPLLEQRHSSEVNQNDHNGKRHEKVTGYFPITKSDSPAVDPVNNSDNVPSRTDRDKSKILVPKDPGKIRQDHDAGGKSQTIGDQTKQAYHSNFPRISSNFDKMIPKSNTPQERIDQQMVNPPTYGQKE